MYDLVHLDGLHAIKYVVEEVAFFDDRLSKGGFIVFDDIDKIVVATKRKKNLFNRYILYYLVNVVPGISWGGVCNLQYHRE